MIETDMGLLIGMGATLALMVALVCSVIWLPRGIKLHGIIRNGVYQWINIHEIPGQELYEIVFFEPDGKRNERLFPADMIRIEEHSPQKLRVFEVVSKDNGGQEGIIHIPETIAA